MRYLTLTLCILVLTGCASVPTRLERYKSNNRYTVSVKVSCDIPAAKNIVRQVIKESNFLVERKQLEKDNFIFANTGYGSYLKKTYLNLLLVPSSTFANLGFFFNYDNSGTTVTIVEETGKPYILSSPGEVYRYTLIDKIKLKSLELTKNN